MAAAATDHQTETETETAHFNSNSKSHTCHHLNQNLNSNLNSLENLLNSSESFSISSTSDLEPISISIGSTFLDPCFPPLSPPLYDHTSLSPSDSPSLSHELSASSICSPRLGFFNDLGSHQSPFDSDCALQAQLASPPSPFDLAQGLGLPIPSLQLTNLDLHNPLPLLDHLSTSTLLAHPPFNNHDHNIDNVLNSPITDLVQKPPPSIFDHTLPPQLMTLSQQNLQLAATHPLPETASPTSSDPSATSPGHLPKKKPCDRSTRTSAPREDFLKRNRVAASKSRAKKKEWQESLEARAQGLGKENVELKKQVRILTVELERLRRLLDQDHHDYQDDILVL